MNDLETNLLTSIVAGIVSYFFSGGSLFTFDKENALFALKAAAGCFVILPFISFVSNI